MDGRRVSVVLLTLNGERYLEEVLDAVFAQRTSFPFEVIAIDSGSTDRTLNILSRHPVRLHRIPNGEFNHGDTRNLGAGLAKGELVAYLTQSATPASDQWLRRLSEAFDVAPDVAAVYGRHIPRPGCDPITRRDIERFFKMHGPPDRPTVRRLEQDRGGSPPDEVEEGIVGFYSDVNSCLRKDVWQRIPYRHLDYAEDQAFGRDVLAAGYAKVYEPRAVVWHSHSYALLKYFRRQFDEYRGLRQSIGFVQQGGLARVIAGAFKGGLADSRYIAAQRYSPPQKAKWLGYAFTMNFLRRLAGYLAARQERLPAGLVRNLSLEAGLKKQAQPRVR